MQAGIFEQAEAILFGDVLDQGEPDGRFLVNKTLHEFSERCETHVLQMKNIGHGQNNNPLLLSTPATLYLGKQCQLYYELNAKNFIDKSSSYSLNPCEI